MGVQRVVLGHCGRDVDSGAGQDRAARSAASPSTLAVTMAQRIRPRSWTVTPGTPTSCRRSLAPSAAARCPIAGRPRSRACRRRRPARGRPRACSQLSKRRAPRRSCRSCAVQSARVHVATGRFEPVAQPWAHRKPVPRGPRRNLRPVPLNASQPGVGRPAAVGRRTGRRPAGTARRHRARSADLRGRVDQAALAGHVGQRDQPDAVVHPAGQVGHVELAVLVVRRRTRPGAGAAGHLEVGDGVAGVLGPAVRIRSPGPNGSE